MPGKIKQTDLHIDMPQKSRYLLIYFIALISAPSLSTAQGERIDIGRFSHSDLSGWEEKSFLNHSHYNLIQANGATVLKAQTSAAASGLYRKVEIDLNKTPFINWSWKIDNIYQGNNERSKEGDDYPARLYVVISSGLFFWQTKSINYVWSNNQAVGSSWDNAYTNHAKMVAIHSGSKKTGLWLTEKRNVHKDFKQLFGEEISKVHIIAIMSDSDNAKQSATAYYGDIYFSAE